MMRIPAPPYWLKACVGTAAITALILSAFGFSFNLPVFVIAWLLTYFVMRRIGRGY